MFDANDTYAPDTTWGCHYLKGLREASGLSIYEAYLRVPHTSPQAIRAAEEGKTVGSRLVGALERVYRNAA